MILRTKTFDISGVKLFEIDIHKDTRGSFSEVFLTNLNFPEFGLSSVTSDAPSTQYYLNQSQVDIGIPNVVTSILAGYRAFDTLGEVLVIFIAGISVLGILREEKDNG